MRVELLYQGPVVVHQVRPARITVEFKSVISLESTNTGLYLHRFWILISLLIDGNVCRERRIHFLRVLAIDH